MSPERRDRILDWHDELRRLTPRLTELPLAARLAVREVVATFEREDADRPDASLAETLNSAERAISTAA
jgi:hypothetical protein